MVTIKDVAKRAGVSIATVSRIINGADNVGEQYWTAVRQAIEEQIGRASCRERVSTRV